MPATRPGIREPRPPATAAGGIHAALASPVRRRLLALLQACETPRDVHDLGDVVGLQPSTVRFHLELLRRAGLVVRRPHPKTGAGRPRTAYTAVGRDSPETTAYQGLAALLATHLADTTEGRVVRADQAGVHWAQQLVPAENGTGRTMAEAARQVTGLFDQIGFEPRLTAIDDGWQIAMPACPFRVVAREYPEVVWSVHLGLLRGILDRLGAAGASQLLPFVEPELCVSPLSPDEPTAPTTTAG